MKPLGILCFVLGVLLGCAKSPAPEVPSETPKIQSAILCSEVLELSKAYDSLLSFWEDPVFMTHGFTANSPYADWLDHVLSLQKRFSYSSQAPWLLTMLAMASKQHGLDSALTQNFKAEFEQELDQLQAQAAQAPLSPLVTP